MISNKGKRAKYPEQNFLKVSGWKYMKIHNEQTLSGIWTSAEHYVFLAIVLHLQKMNKVPLQATDITNLYDKVKKITELDSIGVFLSPKTAAQINAKIKQLDKEDSIAKNCGIINYIP